MGTKPMYIYHDDWYTWFAAKEDSMATDKVVLVPEELYDQYFKALNDWHDARDKIRDIMDGRK